MVARWFISIQAFLVWLLGFVLAMIVLILWHELLMVFVINTLQWSEKIVPVIHILYYMLAGLSLMALFLLSMEYLKQSARKGTLLRVSLLIIGIQLLIIGLAQAALTLYRYFPVDWLGILLIVMEAFLGSGMLFFARHLTKLKDRIGLNQQN